MNHEVPGRRIAAGIAAAQLAPRYWTCACRPRPMRHLDRFADVEIDIAVLPQRSSGSAAAP
jgi:hypothetical protein